MGQKRWLPGILIAGVAIAAVVTLAALIYPRTISYGPDTGGSYLEAVAGPPKFLNPLLVTPDTIDGDISSLVFSGLTKLNERGEPVPDVALRWEVGYDNKTYTFILRDDVQWHDGAPVTAEDVMFTVGMLQDPAYPGTPELGQLWQSIRAELIDSRTVRFQLSEGFAPFLEYASVGLLPAHALRGAAAKNLAAMSFNVRPVGTGPFQVKGAGRDEVVLEANPRYYGLRPYLANLRFHFYADSASALGALTKGEAQGVGRLTPDDLTKVAQDQRFAVYSAADVSKLTLLLFNTRLPVGGDKAVRQAIAYGLDRDSLIQAALGGQGIVAGGPVPPGLWAHADGLPRYGLAADRARQLLDEAGWLPGSDGVRAREGNRLAFVLLVNDKPQRLKLAEEIARQLAPLGIAVEVQAAGWSGVVQDFLVPHRFQAVIEEQWSPNFDPDPYAFWHSSQIASGLNFAGWANRRADELLENARRAPDQQARKPLYDEFQRLFLDELPGIPLSYPRYSFAIDRAVRGVRLGSLVSTADRFDHVEEWYVKTKMVRKSPFE